MILGEKQTSDEDQRFVAIPYSKATNRFVKQAKRNKKYGVKIVERDTLEAKLYLNSQKTEKVRKEKIRKKF